MGWVNPTTWVDGNQVSKGQFADWNNSMAAAGDHTGWTTWAPQIDGCAVGTDGWQRGRKLKVGNLAICAFDYQFGTDANGMNPPNPQPPQVFGVWTAVILPWPASTHVPVVPAGQAYLYNAYRDNTHLMVPFIYSSSRAMFRITFNGTTGLSDAPTILPVWSREAPTGDTGLTAAYEWARVSGIIAYRSC